MSWVGVNQEFGETYLARLREQGVEVRSLVIRQGGKVVYEHATQPFEFNHVHPLYSVTKSFTSTAVGMLVSEGAISLDTPWNSWIPEKQDKVADKRFLSVTVRHLLTMTLGQDAEPFVTGQDDWALGLIGKGLAHDPGTVYFYNSMCSHMLSLLVQRVSGEKLSAFLNGRLFKPLGISTWWWEEDAAGHSTGGFGLHLATPDLAKFGQCLLNGGVWEDKQVIPAAWVQEATKLQVETRSFYPDSATEDRNGYGYQFWMCARGGFRCSGLFGQLCYVRPEDDLVIAASSSTTGSKALMDPLYEVVDGWKPESLDACALDTLAPVLGEKNSAFEEQLLGSHTLLPNAGGFETLNVAREGENLSVELARGDKRYGVHAAYNTWLSDETLAAAGKGTDSDVQVKPIGQLFMFMTHDGEQDEAPAWDTCTPFASYAWVTPTCLEFSVRELDATRRTSLRFTLDGNHVVCNVAAEGMFCGLAPQAYAMATA